MKIEKTKEGKLIYKGDIARSDIVIIPDYYYSIGGMKGIILDVYSGCPDDNDDLYEMCRIMLEDGTFEDLPAWDLELLERQEKFIP